MEHKAKKIMGVSLNCMDLHILSLQDALTYKPDKPTYAIRVFSSRISDRELLQKSRRYKHVAEYVFDDNDTYPFRIECGPRWFDEQTAEAIISDFAEYKDVVGSLLVHCSRGKNRSPAVAMALNEIFGLGHNLDDLMEKHKEYNRFVYHTMLEVAKKR